MKFQNITLTYVHLAPFLYWPPRTPIIILFQYPYLHYSIVMITFYLSGISPLFLCISVCLDFSPYICMIIFPLATPYFQLKIQAVRSRVPRPPPPPPCKYYSLMCVVSRHLVPGTRCGGGGCRPGPAYITYITFYLVVYLYRILPPGRT